MCMYKDSAWIEKQRNQTWTDAMRKHLSKVLKGKHNGILNGRYKSGLHVLRGVIREKANGICTICKHGHKGILSFLDLHHRDRNPENNTIKNLIAICPNCHRREHLKMKGINIRI